MTRLQPSEWIKCLYSRELLLNLLVGACGVLLIAEGLEKWSRVAYGRDVAEARSPLPYASVVRILYEHGENAVPWNIVLAADDPAAACSLLYESVRRVEISTRLLVVAPDTETGAYLCNRTAHAAGLQVQFTKVERPRPAPTTGFVVVGEDGRVVYGARSQAALSRIGAILGLFTKNGTFGRSQSRL